MCVCIGLFLVPMTGWLIIGPAYLNEFWFYSFENGMWHSNTKGCGHDFHTRKRLSRNASLANLLLFSLKLVPFIFVFGVDALKMFCVSEILLFYYIYPFVDVIQLLSIRFNSLDSVRTFFPCAPKKKSFSIIKLKCTREVSMVFVKRSKEETKCLKQPSYLFDLFGSPNFYWVNTK